MGGPQAAQKGPAGAPQMVFLTQNDHFSILFLFYFYSISILFLFYLYCDITSPAGPFFPHAALMPVSTRNNHHLVASYRNPPIRVFAAPPWMLSRTFHFTRKCGCTMARSIITPDQDGKKITVRIKLPADPCKRCLGRCLERAPRF